MRKAANLFGFMMVYIGLILIYHLITQLVFPLEFISGDNSLLNSIAKISLIGTPGNALIATTTLILVSIAFTQLSGFLWLTALLWFYWELFRNENKRSLKDAFLLTVKVSFICEAALLIFFLYSIPIESVEGSFIQKFLAALTLSINSFNNAGLSHINQLMLPNSIQSSFILQLGIIGGSTLGSLGIFVLYELFAPINLRHRLANPETDWSLITKVSIFGFAGLVLISSGLFFFYEKNHVLEDKNLTEAIITSVFEISSSRGFGYSIVENISNSSGIVLFITSIVSAGPFSTGGGITLLSLAWIYSIIVKKEGQSDHLSIINQIASNLIVYSIFAFVILTTSRYIIDDKASQELLNEQWMLFSTNTHIMSSSSSWISDILKGATIISGRIGFIIACFLTLRKTNK